MTISITENANDTSDSEPGDHEGCMKVLKSIISWNPNYQAKHLNQWFVIIEDLYEDTLNKTVGDDLYNEENLIILQDVVNICCLGHYKDDVTDKVMSLTNLWYDVVRAKELAERAADKKRRNQRSTHKPSKNMDGRDVDHDETKEEPKSKRLIFEF